MRKALAFFGMLLLAGCGFDWFPDPPHNGQFTNNSSGFINTSTVLPIISTAHTGISTARRSLRQKYRRIALPAVAPTPQK